MAESPAARERDLICATLQAAGPAAPTLCEGWRTLELAAHLYVRERDPFAGPGIVLPGAFARVTERRMAAAAKKGYEALVDAVRTGPPLHWRLVPAPVQLVEYFVHHEDVRRAQGEGPRPPEAERDGALWRWFVRGAGRFYTRRFSGGLTARLPDGTSHEVRSGEPCVAIVGSVGEMLLFVHGRKDAAHLDFEGPDAAVDAFRATDFAV